VIPLTSSAEIAIAATAGRMPILTARELAVSITLKLGWRKMLIPSLYCDSDFFPSRECRRFGRLPGLSMRPLELSSGCAALQQGWLLFTSSRMRIISRRVHTSSCMVASCGNKRLDGERRFEWSFRLAFSKSRTTGLVSPLRTSGTPKPPRRPDLRVVGMVAEATDESDVAFDAIHSESIP
jgi:hypothetical protein